MSKGKGARLFSPAGGCRVFVRARVVYPGTRHAWRRQKGGGEGSEERRQEVAEGRASGSRAAGEPGLSPGVLRAERGGSGERHL